MFLEHVLEKRFDYHNFYKDLQIKNLIRARLNYKKIQKVALESFLIIFC